ncbi:TfuA-like protein [Rhizobium sp. 18065]|uniref:TfuA-like protein n=1 Tax=Rhizobium sp. 18065 TaxID=2681411 RepID=UPI00135AB96A|nr:TfuA-like protein [Rhizobium sp. 18065]
MVDASAEGPIVVFLGPTLRLAEAERVLDAIYVQPAAQGDILLAAHAYHPRAMVLIDGQFEDRPAVRHKEILWAMAQGIVVIGAASMGALRAAELNEFGMIGVGLIYRWYRRWRMAPDDAVAVLTGPPELGFIPLTHSLVDLQRTFTKLARQNFLIAAERDVLTEIARNTNFRERRFEAIMRDAGYREERVNELYHHLVGQKRLDALLALRNARILVNRDRKGFARSAWVATNTFVRDLEAGGIDSKLVNSYKLNS